MKRNILSPVIAYMLFSTCSIYSQQVISSSGGQSSGIDGLSTYTIGQLTYTTFKENNSSSAQGIQQPYESLTTNNLTVLTYYPNPTLYYITVEILNSKLDNLSYTLFDTNGKSIAYGSFSETKTQIKMMDLETGIYLLKVEQKLQVLKTFKIIKK